MLPLRRYAVFFALAATIFLAITHFKSKNLSVTARTYYHETQNPIRPQIPHIDHPEPFAWSAVPVRHPVTSLTPLPTAKAQKLPKVQFDFPAETPEQNQTRYERQQNVKQVLQRGYMAYFTHAWGKDEVSPVSGGFKDHFGGWAANLVDSLDSLYIMHVGGFQFATDHFVVALEGVLKIDLSKCAIDEINVFETTIRHLGGLLSAYDLSGEKRLLDKAVEFAEMLIVAFDTPNRMPLTRWKPQQALKGPQKADTTVLVAEIGSLSMEFTHLSQLTGNPKYYDAVARITRLFDEQQEKTHLPGMWPVSVDARNEDFTQDTFFTLSAMSDSLYEYLPKMHALLGGADPVYRKMYNGSMAAAIKHTLWRPMTPDNADILMTGGVFARGDAPPRLDPEGQHLSCFAGGMFALGGKLFNLPEHVEIGRKLTDGCLWAYRAFPLGIMPETFHMAPCTDLDMCEWDEHVYHQEVLAQYRMDPSASGGDVANITTTHRLPKGITHVGDPRYILRPEAIESVFILYRITGEQKYQDAAWEMFENIKNATTTHYANAALSDVTYGHGELPDMFLKLDSMESFWMAETLKYFYLIFSKPDVVSLDEWVFNTEAHPFKRPVPS